MFARWKSEHNGAGRFLMLCARIFGTKVVTTDWEGTMTAYHWRGCIYFAKWEPTV